MRRTHPGGAIDSQGLALALRIFIISSLPDSGGATHRGSGRGDEREKKVG